VVGPASIQRAARQGNQLSFARRRQISGAIDEGIKIEGKPPFYLGIAEVASAQALDGSVVLRATISVPEMRPKSVAVQFIVATDVAKVLAEQLPIAVRMAELQKQQGG
jgi:kynureninase